MNIHDFDAIRPYLPEELPEVFERLLGNPQFAAILTSFFPGIPLEMLKQKLLGCRDNLEVQKAFCYPLLKNLLQKCSTSIEFDTASIPAEHRATDSFTFISNHRDIVLDSALLCILLIENGYRTTVEIAIGDNLLIYPWIKDLVRVNKSFIVQRSVTMREMLASSKRMSDYMHFALLSKHENIWIAQREGRAKDSDDRTQESVLKMMAMGGEGTAVERIKAMNLVPLAISYELDPCDFLKAKEYQQKRDIEGFKKSQADDLNNMQTGIFGKKGRIVYRTAAPVNSWIDEIADLPKSEFFRVLAERIDRGIHAGYELYPCNYIACDLLAGSRQHAEHYTAEDETAFHAYLEERISLIDLPEKDVDFLKERILTMYANPVKNHEKAVAEA